MKSVNCWRDLEKYGIRPLTGEACGLMYRLLCDVTAPGKKILGKLLDVELKMPENWNSGAVGSIMQPYEMLVPIGIFALLESGCTEVWLNNGKVIGIEASDNEHVVEVTVANCQRRFTYGGTAGSRNRHVMTDRVL